MTEVMANPAGGRAVDAVAAAAPDGDLFSFLVYIERRERVNDDLDTASAVAIRTAEDRDAWPAEAD